MTNPFLTVARFVKTADPITDKALDDVKQVALLSLGGGAAARGLVGLYNMARRNLAPHKVRYPGAITAPMPYAVSPSPADDEKVADDPAALWRMPAMMGAGMVGGYGGWKALDALLDSRRKSEEQEELENARQGFQSALVQSSPVHKQSADDPYIKLSAALDSLFEKLSEKQASLPDALKQLAGGYLGAYALPMGAFTGVMAYNAAKKNNEASVTSRAMDRRLRHSYYSRPSEVLTVPEPVLASSADGAQSNEQEIPQIAGE